MNGIYLEWDGDWGLGIGDWGLGPIPNPQSPNPQSPFISINSLTINKLINMKNLKRNGTQIFKENPTRKSTEIVKEASISTDSHAEPNNSERYPNYMLRCCVIVQCILYATVLTISLVRYFDKFTLCGGVLSFSILLLLKLFHLTCRKVKEYKHIIIVQGIVISICAYINIFLYLIQVHHIDEKFNDEINFNLNKITLMIFINTLSIHMLLINRPYIPWILLAGNVVVVIIINIDRDFAIQTVCVLVVSVYIVFDSMISLKNKTECSRQINGLKSQLALLKAALKESKAAFCTIDKNFKLTNESCQCLLGTNLTILDEVHSQILNTNKNTSNVGLLESDSILALNKNKHESYFDYLFERLIKDKQNKNDKTMENGMWSLKDSINEYISTSTIQKVHFTSLGVFRNQRQTNQTYKILIKTNSDDVDNHDILFIELITEKEAVSDEKRKNLLLAKISHEFKGPVMLIQSTIDSLLEFCDNQESEGQLTRVKYLAEVILLLILDLNVNTADREIQHLISSPDKSPLASLELSPSFNPSNVEFRALKEFLVNISKVYCSIFDKHIKIKINIEQRLEYSKVVLDDKKLKQVLANLVSNAIKNSTDGSQIEIKFKQNRKKIELNDNAIEEKENESSSRHSNLMIVPAPKEDDEGSDSSGDDKIGASCEKGFSIVIKDSGPGLKQTSLNLFNYREFTEVQFERYKNKVSTELDDYLIKKGLGTGLLICKKLCSQMKAEIKCEMVEDNPLNPLGARGTKFTITFQVQPELVEDNTIITSRTMLVDLEEKQKVFDMGCKPMDNVLCNEINFELGGKENEIKNRRFSFSEITTMNKISNDVLNLPNIVINYSNKQSLLKQNMSDLKDTSLTNKTTPEINNLSLGSAKNITEVTRTFTDGRLEVKPPTRKLRPKSSKYCEENIHIQRGDTMPDGIRKLSQEEVRRRSISMNDHIQLGTEDFNEMDYDKILIVDDNCNYAKSIEKLVIKYYSRNKTNFNRKVYTKTLSDGIELVYEIYQELTRNDGRLQTKIIFSDQMMVYMNGSEAFTILKNICKDKNLKEIPFVICSAFGDSSHKEKMKGNGLNNVYQKPITMGNVEYILDEILK